MHPYYVLAVIGLVAVILIAVFRRKSKSAPAVTAPSHIKTYRVRVDPALSLADAVREGAPETGTGSWIHQVGEQYPPLSGTAREVEATVARYKDGVGSSEAVMAWADANNLEPSVRAMYAVARDKRAIYRDFDLPWAYLTALVSCVFQGFRLVPYVNVDGGRRCSRLVIWAGGWLGGYLFVFVPKGSGV